MDTNGVQRKSYHEVVKETGKAKVFIGPYFFTGQFRFFLYTFLAINCSTVLLIVLGAFVVRSLGLRVRCLHSAGHSALAHRFVHDNIELYRSGHCA